MGGVTILNETIVETGCVPIGIFLIILVSLMIGLSTYIFIISIKDKCTLTLFISVLLLLLSGVFVYVAIQMMNVTTYNRYEVTISDVMSYIKDYPVIVL